jgi:hypothetical protein
MVPSSAELRRAEPATWGLRPRDRAAVGRDHKSRLIILAWNAVRKRSFRGFATVRFPSGLILFDCEIFIGKGGDARAALPARPIIGSDCRQVSPAGRPQYAAVGTFASKEDAHRFSDAIINARRETYPNALVRGVQNGER